MKCFKENNIHEKMENHIVVQLKSLAKQRGIKGYYKLRKAELIQALEAHQIVNEQVILKFFLDESIPDDPTPVLQPTPWRRSNFIAKNTQKIKDFGE